MSAAYHGRHTHLWESPTIMNQEFSNREYEVVSLEGGNVCKAPSKILLYSLGELTSLSILRILLSLLQQDMVIHDQVLSHLGT